MPYDINGRELHVGDSVVIHAKITAVQASPDFCNATVQTTRSMPPYTEGMYVSLNTKQTVKVGSLVGPEDSEAQAAYERYLYATDGLNFRGDECPTWSELPEKIRTAWEAAVDSLGPRFAR